MRREHASRAMVCGYVSGELGVAETHWLELHVSTCPACALELAQEARAELLLYEVGEQRRARRAPRGVARASVSAFASAAAVLLLMFEPTGELEPQRSGGLTPELVFVDDPGTSSTCWQPTDASMPACDEAVALATFPDEDGGLACTSMSTGEDAELVCDSDEPAHG